MRYEDEEFCKLYRRLPSKVKALPWEARMLWLSLWHAVDRAGVLTLDDDPAVCIAAEISAPVPWVARTLPALVAIGQVRLTAHRLLMPEYYPAQAARQSDAARKRAQREREAMGLGPSETPKEGPQTAPPGATYSPPRRAELGASGRGHEAAPDEQAPGSAGSSPADVTKRDASSGNAAARDGSSPLEQSERRDPEFGEARDVLGVLARLRAEGSPLAKSCDERFAKGHRLTDGQLRKLREIRDRWAAAASSPPSGRVAKGGRQAAAPDGQAAWAPVAMGEG